MDKYISCVPGPSHVREDVLRAMADPELLFRLGGSHRSREFTAFFAETLDRLKRFLGTKRRVYIATASATGLMEATIRNGVKKRVVNFACGAFSRRWHDIALACGVEADVVEVEWGEGLPGGLVEKHLATGKYDAMTYVHNETSTGVMNPLREMAEAARKFPDVVVAVDCVSSLGGVRVDADGLGVDMILAGTQKAFGLPPGLAVGVVSDRLYEKSLTLPNRGHYFSFEQYEKYIERPQTPTTPAIPMLAALHYQLGKMLEEGAEAREKRHRAMASRVQAWARERFALFADENYLSATVTCIRNTRAASLSTEKFLAALKERGFLVANGYGKLKGETFRIGHMGDVTEADVERLLRAADEILKK